MNKTTVKRQITPGREITTLSRTEVIKALFVATYNKYPTAEDMKRLSVYCNDRNMRHMDEEDSYMSLTFAERVEDDDA